MQEGLSDIEQVGMTLSCGLCWHVDVDASPSRVVRREGFPSWSWSGWHAAVVFAGDEPKRDETIKSPRQYLVPKTDGSSVALTEELAARMFLDEDVASSYTQRLCIEAEVLDLKFSYIQGGIEYFDHHDLRPRRDTRSSFAVKITMPAGLRDGHPEHPELKTYHWALLVTPHFEEGDEVHSSLCNRVFQCVVLSKHWGLVVQENKGVFERMGLIRLFCENTEAINREETRPNLRDHFPSSVREIVLG